MSEYRKERSRVKKYYLKADEMKTKEQAATFLKEIFGIDQSFDFTLDLLYMEIMSIKSPAKIILDDASSAVDNLGRFGLGLIKLFRDAASESDNIDFEW